MRSITEGIKALEVEDPKVLKTLQNEPSGGPKPGSEARGEPDMANVYRKEFVCFFMQTLREQELNDVTMKFMCACLMRVGIYNSTEAHLHTIYIPFKW